MAVRIKTNAFELAKQTAQLSAALRSDLIRAAVEAFLDVHLEEVQRSTQARLAKDPTGALLRSWEVYTYTSGNKVGGGVRSGLPYARIHDRGGTITAKAGRNLAIPILANVGRASRGLWPRHDSTPMRAWRSKRGKLLLWDVSRSPAIPRYVLQPSVTIPATRYIQLGVEAAERPAVEAFTTTITEALDRAQETTS